MARRRQTKRKEQRKAQTQLKTQKLPLKQTPPNTLNASSPLGRFYHVLLLSTTRLAKSSTNFVRKFSPFGNELIKHKPREAKAMHEIKIRVLHKAYKQVFKQLYINMPRLAK
jgi:hypothetical protein